MRNVPALRKKLHQLGDALISLIYPRRCPICDNPVKPWNALICRECECVPEYIEAPFCMKCGAPLQTEDQEYCKGCRLQPHLFERGRAVFSYRSVSPSIFRFKFAGRQEYAVWYADCIARSLGGFLREVRPDALVPVPLHGSKFRKRGYNQAELLARALSAGTGIPAVCNLIARVEKTAPMKDLSAAERQNNLKRAFKIRRNDVKLKTILIIDDIYTTGATVDAMSRALKKAGVERVYFIALAIGRGV